MYYVSLVIIAAIFIWRVSSGFKKGLVKEVISLIAMVAGGICMMLILSAVGSYREEAMGQTIQFIFVLGAVCFAYRIANIFFTSLRLISKLPVIKGMDKLLGAAAGFLEAVFLIAICVHFLKNWGISQIIH